LVFFVVAAKVFARKNFYNDWYFYLTASPQTPCIKNNIPAIVFQKNNETDAIPSKG
jgi:hypothetical protein